MPESLDLAALRENLRGKAEYDKFVGYPYTWVIPEQMLAVLALVDEQRDRISTLEEALRQIEAEAGGTERWYRTRAYLALAGSPSANKEQQ